jgi:hypothetical protein
MRTQRALLAILITLVPACAASPDARSPYHADQEVTRCRPYQAAIADADWVVEGFGSADGSTQLMVSKQRPAMRCHPAATRGSSARMGALR